MRITFVSFCLYFQALTVFAAGVNNRVWPDPAPVSPALAPNNHPVCERHPPVPRIIVSTVEDLIAVEVATWDPLCHRLAGKNSQLLNHCLSLVSSENFRRFSSSESDIETALTKLRWLDEERQRHLLKNLVQIRFEDFQNFFSELNGINCNGSH